MFTEGLAKASYELALYHSFASKMFEGHLPYKDFFPEYPPLSLFFMSLPQYFGDKYYTLAYYGLVAICTAIVVFLINKMGGKMWAALAAIMPIDGLFWDRFDVFPAFLTVISIFLVTRKNYVWASFVMALGFMTKIYPIFLMPIIAFLLLRKPRKIIPSIIAFVLPIVIITGYIVNYGGKDGLLKFVEYQGKRGIHLESFKATPLLYKYLKGQTNLVVEYNHASYEIKEISK